MSQPEAQANTPTHQSPIRQDYDSAWKAALEKYFKEFLELLFPAVHAAVDWTKGHEFLDGELEKITVDAKTGRRYTDKLVKVYYQDGSEEWLLIHVVIQSLPEAKNVFAKRMFTYWSRLIDRYQVDVVSLAVLADTNQNYRPSSFHFSRSGTENTFSYPMVKLTDFESADAWASLEANNNVFALLVMAQIKAKRLKGNNQGLYEFRLGLTRSLYKRGYTREQVVELFNFIGWMIQLPELLEDQLFEAIKVVEEELKMPYINVIEQYGIRQGLKQGLEQGLEQGRLEAEQRFAQDQLEKTKNIARSMFSVKELNDERIAEITGLALEDVAQLRLEHQH